MSEPASNRDRLTLKRSFMLLLGMGAGVGLFWRSDNVWELAPAVLTGVSLVGPLLVWPRGGRRLGVGGWLWFALGIGVWLMMPAVAAIWLIPISPKPGFLGNINVTIWHVCLLMTLPIGSLCFMLALVAGGRLTRQEFRWTSPWSERFGIWLGLAWSLLGAWAILQMYGRLFVND